MTATITEPAEATAPAALPTDLRTIGRAIVRGQVTLDQINDPSTFLALRGVGVILDCDTCGEDTTLTIGRAWDPDCMQARCPGCIDKHGRSGMRDMLTLADLGCA